MSKILQTLKKHFGYTSFRPLQEEVITSFLKKEDAVVIMPTGGGKSLCFQLPALTLNGVTIVISPLISLMKDQVDSLNANGISATFLNSSVDYAVLQERMDGVESGQYELIYMAPERLAVPGVMDWLKSCSVAALAVDEAHCISQWGHDFRPDYRNLRMFRKEFPHIPIIALTATATPGVKEDIISELSINKARVFTSSFYRDNLHLTVMPKRDEIRKIFALLEKHEGESVIIYCFSRKDTEKLAQTLSEEGISAAAYHGGMKAEDRSLVQDKFIRDEVKVITATIAFGMGIDKSNVRLIIHRTFPKTMEGYYQEIGRAGRDGLVSECVMLYSAGDKIKLDFFLNDIRNEEEREKEEKNILEVMQYAESRTCRWKSVLEYFGENHDMESCGTCDVCLACDDIEDATVITQKILSTVLRTGERFGKAHILKVMRGSREQNVLERSHDSLSVFGIAKEYSNAVLSEFFMLIVAKGLLQKSIGEYPTYFVTDKGKNFLKNNETIELPKIQAEISSARSKAPLRTSSKVKKTTVDTLEYDIECFEELRVLRKKLADKKKVPAFVIFSDASLRQMAHTLPQTLDEFLEISGVGASKQKKFGKIFTEAISSFVKNK